MAKAKQPADSKQLENAVEDAVDEAQDEAREGNVATVKQTGDQPAEDLPTGARSHLQ